MTEGQEKPRCSEMVPGEGRWGAFHMQKCKKPGSVERNGKRYCKVHDPVRRKERDDLKREEWNQKYEADRQRSEFRAEAVNVCSGVPIEKLRELGSGWLEKKLKEISNG